MATARRHRPLLPRTARVRWDPAMGWPFPSRSEVPRKNLALATAISRVRVRVRAAKRAVA